MRGLPSHNAWCPWILPNCLRHHKSLLSDPGHSANVTASTLLKVLAEVSDSLNSCKENTLKCGTTSLPARRERISFQQGRRRGS